MKISINKTCSFLFKDKIIRNITFTLILLFNSTLSSSEIPKIKISNFHNTLIKINSSDKEYNERLEIIKEVINKTFNYKKMVRFIYGRNWNKLELPQKEKLISTFFNFISANYTKRFYKINKLNFEYLDSKITDDGMILIDTNLITPGEDPVTFRYVFINEKEDWQILDILINGTISEIATKKSEFSKIIHSEGSEGLITKLLEKINDPN